MNSTKGKRIVWIVLLTQCCKCSTLYWATSHAHPSVYLCSHTVAPCTICTITPLSALALCPCYRQNWRYFSFSSEHLLHCPCMSCHWHSRLLAVVWKPDKRHTNKSPFTQTIKCHFDFKYSFFRLPRHTLRWVRHCSVFVLPLLTQGRLSDMQRHIRLISPYTKSEYKCCNADLFSGRGDVIIANSHEYTCSQGRVMGLTLHMYYVLSFTVGQTTLGSKTCDQGRRCESVCCESYHLTLVNQTQQAAHCPGSQQYLFSVADITSEFDHHMCTSVLISWLSQFV